MQGIELRTRLDQYYGQTKSVILDKQHPISGLLPASTAVTVHGNYQDAWVRDNVYSILAVWGLALAYRNLDDDGGRGFELQQRTVKLMRALLRSMMAQSTKVEKFKTTRQPIDALHAKYDTATGNCVVGDDEWGHLQVDATSVYLLTLAQMIASGLEIIWTDEEVSFIQNLVYYIERAYRTPDFGIWERGAKSNSGNVELNASSLGMAKAALEALSGFNLFGAKGSRSSIIHVIPDNIAQSNITLTTMLPRESNTKETDAALLSIIGYPAFAVDDQALANTVRNDIIQKLQGNYGLKRFLRDGHQTAIEDEGRLHYEEQELKEFEHIESEWPLFYTYLYLDALFRDDREQITEYRKRLDTVLVEQNGQKLLPELYFVPEESVEKEREQPGSQKRIPNDNVPLVWAQSLFILGGLLEDELLRPGDLDPLGRRHIKVPKKPVVQLIFLAEDQALKQELESFGVSTQTLEDISPIQVYRPEDIAAVHAQIGQCHELGLSGRIPRRLKSLSTSRVYMMGKQRAVCLTPSFIQRDFFLSYDIEFLVSRFKTELSYLHRNWTEVGRPTMTVLLTHNLLDTDRNAFYALMKQIASGEVEGIPVLHGLMSQLINTAAVEHVEHLKDLVLPEAPLTDLLSQSCVLTLAGEHKQLLSSEEIAIALETNVSTLEARLNAATNLYEQIALLTKMVELQSIDAKIHIYNQQRSVRELIEEVYTQAGRLRLWSVLRQATGLQGKIDGDIGLAVGDLLVAQKFIQVGRSYHDGSLITRPISDEELMQRIIQYCREDVRDQILTQEVLLYLGLLIKARPELFSELITVRASLLIILLTSQIARTQNCHTDEAYDMLMDMPPSEVQSRLEVVLENFQSLADLPQKMEVLHAHGDIKQLNWRQNLGLEQLDTPTEGWLAWRQHQGIIDRRSSEFLGKVWRILHHTSGLVIGNKMDKRNRINSSLVLSDMTEGEKAFALLIEHMFNNIHAAEYRQLSIETLNALSSFFEQNPTLIIDDAIVIDVTIGHAVNLAFIEQYPERQDNYQEHKSHAWESFYAQSPARSTTFIISALNHLLIITKEKPLTFYE
jgi:phosphorylase kinase alpha/beta subunit